MQDLFFHSFYTTLLHSPVPETKTCVSSRAWPAWATAVGTPTFDSISQLGSLALQRMCISMRKS